MNPYVLPEGLVQIAFSGGRTSAYMLHHILDANGGLPDRARVVFTNTGREMPETLDFVAECGARWGVQIDWIERRFDGDGFAVVSHNSASRDGEPFIAMVEDRRYLPNSLARFCTGELKAIAANLYLSASFGWTEWSVALGFRADEAHRAEKPRHEAKGFTLTPWFPLIPARVGRHDVAGWWKRQSFDLRLPAHKGRTIGGNCDGCFLKSEKVLAGLCRDFPERHAWWERLEQRVGQITGNPEGARFSSRYSRRELREFMERQGDLALSTEGMLCQATDGECFG